MKLDFRAGLFGVLAIFGIVGASLDADAGLPTAIYTFKGGSDGRGPSGNLVADPAGNLYGVTVEGGAGAGLGVVFELSPPVPPSTTWTETVIHSFTGGDDGDEPQGGLVRDAAGNLYGTAFEGGRTCTGCGSGVAFELSPPTNGSTAWEYTVIYQFRPAGGVEPQQRMVLDRAGNLYGVTFTGGLHPGCCGVAFELSPPASGRGPWTETLLHVFTNSNGDGSFPSAGLTFDNSGNLFGTTSASGFKSGCCGIIFRLSPSAGATVPWTETILHTFTGPDGRLPVSDLVFDESGNLYGAAGEGDGNGSICGHGCGTAVELSPPASGSGPWTEKTLYRFPGSSSAKNPLAVAYANGLLYGATAYGGAQGQGALFVLSPTTKKFWNIAVDSFSGASGTTPVGSLITNPAVSGLTMYYGVARDGGSGAGTVFSWTP